MNEIVTRPLANAAGQRTLSCARCGTAFTCNLSGSCWCSDETAKLPLPAEGEDCLCQACLRAAAARTISPP
ncbi:cysteine-rich CWC family protein [Afipia clevelandensis]|uniref:cysteine-rich CWC family protein n=1 Tax=Afipia clevelandensis TaxID=1034 RepID=UPI0003199DAF|nr:cysteine-rich CWC family protein [Afipia clevelandensis]